MHNLLWLYKIYHIDIYFLVFKPENTPPQNCNHIESYFEHTFRLDQPTERLWLSPGLAGGVIHAWRVLRNGPALVRGGHRPLHFAREQPQGGIWLLRSRRAAQVSRDPGAARHRIHDLCPHGLFCFHDICPQGEKQKRIFFPFVQCFWSFLFFAVHSDASAVRSLPLHGGLLSERHPSEFLKRLRNENVFPNAFLIRFLLFPPQFFDRIKLFGMPAKHQPDLIYLRYVPLWKVHIFTLVQLTCLVLLWVIKASAAAVVFPMMVEKSHLTLDTLWKFHIFKEDYSIGVFFVVFFSQVLALVFIRKLLDFFFTKRELSWLDDLIPESKKKKEDDKKKKARAKLVLAFCSHFFSCCGPVGGKKLCDSGTRINWILFSGFGAKELFFEFDSISMKNHWQIHQEEI